MKKMTYSSISKSIFYGNAQKLGNALVFKGKKETIDRKEFLNAAVLLLQEEPNGLELEFDDVVLKIKLIREEK